jgi:hypothetical protein
VTERYSFIDAECAETPGEDAGDAPAIMQVCGWLGVSKSGYYDWRTRPQSPAAKRRELLKIKIKALFEANNDAPMVCQGFVDVFFVVFMDFLKRLRRPDRWIADKTGRGHSGGEQALIRSRPASQCGKARGRPANR